MNVFDCSRVPTYYFIYHYLLHFFGVMFVNKTMEFGL